MAVAVEGYDELVRRVEAVRELPEPVRPRLLAFFLVDERKSQRAVRSFIDADYAWLDSLARSSNIVLLFFRASKPTDTNDNDAVIIFRGKPVERGSRNKNPSLDVAAKFGITPDQLPGIVFFRDFDFTSKREPVEGVYWRIPSEYFQEERNILEDDIAGLFALVQDAESKSHDATSMLHELETTLESLQRTDDGKPFFTLLGSGLMQVVKYSGRLIDTVIAAFGRGYGEALAAKYG